MPGLLFYRGKFWVITRLTCSSDSVRPSSACLPRAVGVRCPGEKQISKIAKSESESESEARIEIQSNTITRIYASRVSSCAKEMIEIKESKSSEYANYLRSVPYIRAGPVLRAWSSCFDTVRLLPMSRVTCLPLRETQLVTSSLFLASRNCPRRPVCTIYCAAFFADHVWLKIALKL